MSCTSVIVGKGVSIDGSVTVAKGEDIAGDTAQQLEIIPQKHYENGEVLFFESGREIPQVPMTYRAIQFNSKKEPPLIKQKDIRKVHRIMWTIAPFAFHAPNPAQSFN